MIGGESTEKSLADLRQEFEQMLGVVEQQDVQKIMLDVTRGGLSVADAENALRRSTMKHMTIHPVVLGDARKICLDFIIVHYTVGEGWDWGGCPKERDPAS